MWPAANQGILTLLKLNPDLTNSLRPSLSHPTNPITQELCPPDSTPSNSPRERPNWVKTRREREREGMLLGKLSQRNIFLILVHVFLLMTSINAGSLKNAHKERMRKRERKKERQREKKAERERGKKKRGSAGERKRCKKTREKVEMTLMPFRQSSESFRKSLLILFILFSYSQCLALSFEHL